MGLTLYQLFWYFSIYAVVGWCVEVCFCTVNTGKFVNRGFLNGPVCPIYGFGMVTILILLLPLQDNILLLFAGSVVLTSALELVTGFVLKKMFHTSWWDYSDVPFNIGGYICLKFSLAWGLGGVIVVRVIHPFVAMLVEIVPHIVGVVLIPVVLALFLCDAAVTAAGIGRMNRDLGRITEIAKGLRAGSDVLAKDLGDTALAVDVRVVAARGRLTETADAAKVKAAAAKLELTEKAESAKLELSEKAESAKQGLSEKAESAKLERAMKLDLAKAGWVDRKHFISARLLKAYPRMKSERNGEALDALREWYRKK